MTEIISKELLSEVLGETIKAFRIDGKYIDYQCESEDGYDDNINIYELSHKCKEKARKYGYSITTGNRIDGTARYDILCIHKDEDIECGEAVFFNDIADTEPNGIFMAMQWILDNKDK